MTGNLDREDMKPRVNFINVLRVAFTSADPKSAKKTDDLTAYFAFWGYLFVKAVQKMLVKLTPWPD